MPNVRLSRALCAVIGEALRGSHGTLDALFISAGAPGEPPALSHGTKWKEWLFRAGVDETVDSLAVLGNILEEFMDIAPRDEEDRADWESRRQRVVDELEKNGFRYYQGGRVLPVGKAPAPAGVAVAEVEQQAAKPSSIEELLKVLVKGLPRAIYPLQHRRKGATSLSFLSEYDVQDLLHALLRPWISDVRPEEFTPSYAGTSARMDFFLPDHNLVIEIKLVRDKRHAAKIGDELIIDVDHYRAHPGCTTLWCVIYDPNHFIENAGGLIKDLEGVSKNDKGTVTTKVFVLS